jgi:hypothetical protein
VPLCSVKAQGQIYLTFTSFHEGVWGSGSKVHTFLTLALERGELSASGSSPFARREVPHGTHWTRGSVRSKISVDVEVKKKIYSTDKIEPQSTDCLAAHVLTNVNDSSFLKLILNQNKLRRKTRQPKNKSYYVLTRTSNSIFN